MNRLLKIKLKLLSTSGNSNRNTVEIPFEFKTVDSSGKEVYKNRGRAITDLLYYLMDYNLANSKDVLVDVLNYDRDHRLNIGKINNSKLKKLFSDE